MTEKTVITVYGIPNCDTIRRARKWLDENGIDYHFHDYRKGGVGVGVLRAWADALGWEALLNRRGTTWRKLPEPERHAVDHAGDAEPAIVLMADHPALIKRPLFDLGDGFMVGFSATEQAALADRLGIS